MNTYKLGPEEYKQLEDIISKVASEENIDDVVTAEIDLKKESAVIKYKLAVDVENLQAGNLPTGSSGIPQMAGIATNYMPGAQNIQQQPARLQTPEEREKIRQDLINQYSKTDVQKAQEQATSNIPKGQSVSDVITSLPGMAMNYNPNTQPGQIAQPTNASQAAGAQQAAVTQTTGSPTSTWDPQLRGQKADLVASGSGQTVPILFEGAINPNTNQVQVWNTATNSKQWVDMSSVVQPGTTTSYPFQTSANANAGTGNAAGGGLGTPQARYDLQEFYNRLSKEKKREDKESFSVGEAIKFTPSIIETIKVLWEAFNEYNSNEGQQPIGELIEKSTEDFQEEPKIEEEKVAGIVSSSDKFLNFATEILTNPTLRPVIEKKLKPETIQKLERRINTGTNLIEVIKAIKDIRQKNMGKRGEIIQLNSETFLVKKGSEIYNSIERHLEETAKEKSINNVKKIAVEIKPDKFKIVFYQENKTADIMGGLMGMVGTGGMGLGLLDKGGILGQISQLGQAHPLLTGAASSFASYQISKSQGKDFSFIGDGLVPFLAGSLGGPFTAAGLNISKAMGWGTMGMIGSCLVGFFLDNLLSKDATQDPKEKQTIDIQNNDITKALLNDPAKMQQVASEAQRRGITPSQLIEELIRQKQ